VIWTHLWTWLLTFNVNKMMGLPCLTRNLPSRYIDLDLFLRPSHEHIIPLIIVAPVTVDNMIEFGIIIFHSILDFVAQRIFVRPSHTPLSSAPMTFFITEHLPTICKSETFIAAYV